MVLTLDKKYDDKKNLIIPELEIDPIKLGANIAEKRESKPGEKRKKMSQEELGASIGVGRRTIASWESGKKLPSLEHILKLCWVFECDIHNLLGERFYSTQEIEYICKKTGLTEKTVRMLTDYDYGREAELSFLISYFCETFSYELPYLLKSINEYIDIYKKNEEYIVPSQEEIRKRIARDGINDEDVNDVNERRSRKEELENKTIIAQKDIEKTVSRMIKELHSSPMPIREWCDTYNSLTQNERAYSLMDAGYLSKAGIEEYEIKSGKKLNTKIKY